MARYAVELVFGDDEATRLAVRPAHREYLATLVERGVLVLSGPWVDDTGALLVFEVDGEGDLEKIFADDPYTPAGVVAETRVHEWKTVMGTWLPRD
ncbi:YciI family protein [Actinosynnema sp. NPDC020468]|uniref:YciI family protein n=1 Tax=Actinosynnema sp. NPDC020468 TaxID=3154488 RepID=UPI0033E404DC